MLAICESLPWYFGAFFPSAAAATTTQKGKVGALEAPERPARSPPRSAPAAPAAPAAPVVVSAVDAVDDQHHQYLLLATAPTAPAAAGYANDAGELEKLAYSTVGIGVPREKQSLMMLSQSSKSQPPSCPGPQSPLLQPPTPTLIPTHILHPDVGSEKTRVLRDVGNALVKAYQSMVKGNIFYCPPLDGVFSIGASYSVHTHGDPCGVLAAALSIARHVLLSATDREGIEAFRGEYASAASAGSFLAACLLMAHKAKTEESWEGFRGNLALHLVRGQFAGYECETSDPDAASNVVARMEVHLLRSVPVFQLMDHNPCAEVELVLEHFTVDRRLITQAEAMRCIRSSFDLHWCLLAARDGCVVERLVHGKKTRALAEAYCWVLVPNLRFALGSAAEALGRLVYSIIGRTD